MNQPPKKQFVLYHPVPWNEASRITFEGFEWAGLMQASQSIVGKYGPKIAMEIHGRSFVLDAPEAQKVANAKIPFKLGFLSEWDGNFVALEGNGDNQNDHLRWLPDEEQILKPAENDMTVIEEPKSTKIINQAMESHLWKRGTIGRYSYEAKVYDQPSQYGIHDGTISKLTMRLTATGEEIVVYDREWIQLPAIDEYGDLHEAIDLLVAHYSTKNEGGEV